MFGGGIYVTSGGMTVSILLDHIYINIYILVGTKVLSIRLLILSFALV